MARSSTFLLAVMVAMVLSCGHSKNRQPPGAPPSPESISRSEPGGNANDPHEAALERLATEEWGWRNDRQDAFHFPLSDWSHWRRVRFWGLPTFVGFRYGNTHRAVAALWVKRLPANEPEDLNLCLDRMEAWATPIASAYETTFVKGNTSYASWKSKDDVLVQHVDAEIRSLFSRQKYRAVVGVSFGWPRVCVLYGYAFRVGKNEALVDRVRDRYAREAFSRLTVFDPLRSPDGVEDLPTENSLTSSFFRDSILDSSPSTTDHGLITLFD